MGGYGMGMGWVWAWGEYEVDMGGYGVGMGWAWDRHALHPARGFGFFLLRSGLVAQSRGAEMHSPWPSGAKTRTKYPALEAHMEP